MKRRVEGKIASVFFEGKPKDNPSVSFVCCLCLSFFLSFFFFFGGGGGGGGRFLKKDTLGLSS